jgi:hypothetical protein
MDVAKAPGCSKTLLESRYCWCSARDTCASGLDVGDPLEVSLHSPDLLNGSLPWFLVEKALNDSVVGVCDGTVEVDHDSFIAALMESTSITTLERKETTSIGTLH